MLVLIRETSVRSFSLWLASVGVLLSLAGCGPQAPVQTQPQPKIISSPFDETLGKDNDTKGATFTAIHLRSIMLEVPAGIISNSEEIWSYLQEEPIGAQRLSTLSRNGWRVALGRSNSWSDVSALLKKMTGRPLLHSEAVARPGTPIHLSLKSITNGQTIFQFHDDKTISGADFPKGQNMLSIVCTVDPDNTDRLIVTSMPQIRANASDLKYQLGNKGVIIKNSPKMFGFPDMLFQLPVKKDEFIVVGPGIASRRFNSVGRKFLVRQKEGMDFETIIILRPYAVTVNPQNR